MSQIKWSPKLVGVLRSEFLNGKTIKDIAAKINKTPSSVNKALSRFGIRHQSAKEITKATKIPFKKSANRNAKISCVENLILDENWVDFSQVIEFLELNNIKIIPLNEHSNISERKFFVDKKQYSSMQVLMLANKLRCDQKLNVFLVNNLSW